jgi:hypothetical protein
VFANPAKREVDYAPRGSFRGDVRNGVGRSSGPFRVLMRDR